MWCQFSSVFSEQVQSCTSKRRAHPIGSHYDPKFIPPQGGSHTHVIPSSTWYWLSVHPISILLRAGYASPQHSGSKSPNSRGRTGRIRCCPTLPCHEDLKGEPTFLMQAKLMHFAREGNHHLPTDDHANSAFPLSWQLVHLVVGKVTTSLAGSRPGRYCCTGWWGSMQTLPLRT